MAHNTHAKSRMPPSSQGGVPPGGALTHETFTTVINDRISTPMKGKVPCGISVNSNSSVKMYVPTANSVLNKNCVDSIEPNGSTEFDDQGHGGWAN